MGMSPAKMLEAIEKNLPSKTGHTLEEWIEIVKSDGPPERKGIIKWLKENHSLGHGTAQMIATKTLQPVEYSLIGDVRMIDDQYSGDKAPLKLIYEKIRDVVMAFGDDVELGPRKTYVSFSRKRQFTIVQPTTKTRIDIGLILPDTKPTERLKPAGNFGSGRTTHKLSIQFLEEIDDEVELLLKSAYEAA